MAQRLTFRKTSGFICVLCLWAGGLFAFAPLAFADSGEYDEYATEPLEDFELAKYQYCGTDRDCVKANNGCCDCGNGGQDVAVNKERLEAFQDRFRCTDIGCTERAQVPACGSGLVACLNHRCKYVERGAAALGASIDP